MKAFLQSIMAAIVIIAIGSLCGLFMFIVLGALSGCNDDRNPPAPVGHDPDGPGLHCQYYCPDVGSNEETSTSTDSTSTTTGSDNEQETSSSSCGDTE